MNKFIYFMAVGLAFTVMQVATVEAAPATTGDDAHTGEAQDCANLKNPDGSAASPEAVAICWQGQSSHADGAHAGMAPGTTAGATSDGAGAPNCAALPTPAEVAACWDSNTAGGPAGGAGGCADEETPA